MPTFKEIAQGYAAKVRTATRLDGFTKAAAAAVKSTDLPGSAILKVAKEITANLDTYRVDGQPLTEEQRKTILELAGQELELAMPSDFYWFIKGGSNDAYMQMITYVGNIVKKAGS